jgi:ATP-dependent DNA helicase RecG
VREIRMETENQNIEWKESWRDDYLKWICGFSNASGGKLIIGKNDKGRFSEINNIGRLLEEIPNKVRDILGIIVETNLIEENNNEIIEIIVEPHPFPVNFKGKYYIRSGSTLQHLKGEALNRFLLAKQGKKWDGVPVPNIGIEELDKGAFDKFKKMSLRSGRISSDEFNENREVLLENLRLLDGKFLKRAAILLFFPDPEKFITGAYVKMGFFRTDDELLYQDEIHGNLFDQAEKTIDLIYTKYLKAEISYEGINRVERFPFPRAALREAVLNAIVHKDYSSGNPIQISIYSNKVFIYNDGELPENWTIDKLQAKHPSRPFNPDIANAFFRSGLIEAWGRGIHKINSECNSYGIMNPKFNYDFSGFVVEFLKVKIYSDSINEKIGRIREGVSYDGEKKLVDGEKMVNDGENDVFDGEKSVNDGEKSVNDGEKTLVDGENVLTNRILNFLVENDSISMKEISKKLGLSLRTVERKFTKLKEQNLIRRVGPAKGGYWEIINPVD